MPGTGETEKHSVSPHEHSTDNGPKEEVDRPSSDTSGSARRRHLGPGSPRFERTLRELDPWCTEWVRPDTRYPKLLLVNEIIWGAVVTAALCIPLVMVSLGWWNWPWLWLAIAVPAAYAVGVVISVALVPRRARARGYSERDDDLLIRHGAMWHKVNAIPYGRLQTVEVSVGPLERRFGLAKVELHTASSSTDAKIEGITAEEAARLRHELTERGDNRLAGL